MDRVGRHLIDVIEEYKQRVFENRVFRKIFRSKRDEVKIEWRRLHNKVFHDACSSRNIIRMIESRGMRWAGHVAGMGERRGVYEVLIGIP